MRRKSRSVARTLLLAVLGGLAWLAPAEADFLGIIVDDTVLTPV